MMTLHTNDGEKEQEYCAGLGTCDFRTGQVVAVVFIDVWVTLIIFLFAAPPPLVPFIALPFGPRPVCSSSLLPCSMPSPPPLSHRSLAIPAKPRQQCSPPHVFLPV